MDQDNIGHLSVVDIKLDLENAGEKQLFFNEIYSPIFKRSVFQLRHAMSLNDNGTINSFKTTAKAHATMDEKIRIPLYVEHLHLLLTRCGWRIGKN